MVIAMNLFCEKRLFALGLTTTLLGCSALRRSEATVETVTLSAKLNCSEGIVLEAIVSPAAGQWVRFSGNTFGANPVRVDASGKASARIPYWLEHGVPNMELPSKLQASVGGKVAEADVPVHVCCAETVAGEWIGIDEGDGKILECKDKQIELRGAKSVAGRKGFNLRSVDLSELLELPTISLKEDLKQPLVRLERNVPYESFSGEKRVHHFVMTGLNPSYPDLRHIAVSRDAVEKALAGATFTAPQDDRGVALLVVAPFGFPVYGASKVVRDIDFMAKMEPSGEPRRVGTCDYISGPPKPNMTQDLKVTITSTRTGAVVLENVIRGTGGPCPSTALSSNEAVGSLPYGAGAEWAKRQLPALERIVKSGNKQ